MGFKIEYKKDNKQKKSFVVDLVIKNLPKKNCKSCGGLIEKPDSLVSDMRDVKSYENKKYCCWGCSKDAARKRKTKKDRPVGYESKYFKKFLEDDIDW